MGESRHAKSYQSDVQYVKIRTAFHRSHVKIKNKKNKKIIIIKKLFENNLRFEHAINAKHYLLPPSPTLLHILTFFLYEFLSS
jgi:hypothetical protein